MHRAATQPSPGAPRGSHRATPHAPGTSPGPACQPPELRPGAMVTANLRLVHPIAEGGMGSLWEAEHLTLHTHVAVKFMRAELAAEHPEMGTRFSREASISARVRSVHAVQIFDHGTTADGTPYIVMELLEGCTLDEWLEVNDRLSLHDTAVIISQLAKVLQRAHVLGVVHRDIKPENIFLVDSDYQLFVKILDFGVAKQSYRPGRQREVTKTGIAVGTPGYISPEQAINAKRVDHRADLWALGALAYRLLTGMLPYGDDAGEEPWWLRLASGSFTPPCTLAPELPPEADAWFARALDTKPERRFDSAKEMAAALGAIAELGLDGRPSFVDLPLMAAAVSSGSDTPAAPTAQPSAAPEPPPPSTIPGQYDLFAVADDQTEDGTVIMDEGDHVVAAKRDSDRPSQPSAPPARPPLPSWQLTPLPPPQTTAGYRGLSWAGLLAGAGALAAITTAAVMLLG